MGGARAALCCAVVCAAPAAALTGVDVSSAVTEEKWKCMRTGGSAAGGYPGIEFAVIRAYRSSGTPDPNAAATINAARAAGVPDVDAYLFPCLSCSTPPQQQVADCMQNLNASGARVGRLWMDIEGTHWNDNKTLNQQFFLGLVQSAKTLGVPPAVYASHRTWGDIMGLEYDGAVVAGPELWYAHYDECPAYDDWDKFGGWTQPTVKQYAGTTSSCGASVDYNFRAGGSAPTTPAPALPGACTTFHTGMCPGDADCQCTFHESCCSAGAPRRAAATRNRTASSCASQGGECYTVVHGACPGGAGCMKYGDACG